MFETTIAGSLPKPNWLAEPEKLWAPWRLEGEALARGKQDAATIKNAARHVDAERIRPCTNCGMAPLPRDVAIGKLKAFGAGAALARRSL